MASPCKSPLSARSTAVARREHDIAGAHALAGGRVVRRPTPPAVPRWTVCPEEARGLACPTAHHGLKWAAIAYCDQCRSKPFVPVGNIVIETAARVIHWTCTCGAPQVSVYDEYVEQGHYICPLVRSGADVLRGDAMARAAAAMLESKIRRVTS